MISASVSNLALYEMWAKDEALDLKWILDKLSSREATPAMAAGSAFHSAMETIEEGKEYGVLTANGYRFNMLCDVDIPLPKIQEVSIQKQYGDLLVRGRVDAWSLGTISDYKTTEQFDPDRFLDRITWRLYLDMTGVSRFIWHVFQVKESGEKEYDVYNYHSMTQYRYVGMHEDCERVAAEYCRFAGEYLVKTGTEDAGVVPSEKARGAVPYIQAEPGESLFGEEA